MPPETQESNCTSTVTFSKKIKWYFKYYRQYLVNADDLERGFKYILEEVKKRNFQLGNAAEYFESNNFSGISQSLFKEYKVFESGNLYFIFVICEQCIKNLKCRLLCTRKPEIIVCFYDIWIKQG